MGKVLSRIGLTLGLAALCSGTALADVTVTEPTGGNGISADTSANSTNGAAFTPLGAIIIAENNPADFGVGTNQTFILTLPPGFRFLTAGAPTTASFSANGDITQATVAVSSSDITVTLTVKGSSHLDTLSITNLQVQAMNGSDPNALLGGPILNQSANPGTATIAGIFQDGTEFASLYLNPGNPTALGIYTQPSPTATAGVIFASQPDVDTFDQFGNQCYQDNSTVITASRAAGTGTLQGTTTSDPVIGGDFSYFDLSFKVANTITILFTAPGLASVTSSNVVVGAGTASRLAFTTQPGSAASGFPFGIQPVINSQDQFGNNSTVGLPANQNVTLTLTSGTGPLLGGTNQDLGTSAGNGVATYTNLEIDATGNKQLTASSVGFVNATSSVFNVSGAAFSQLLVLTPGETFVSGTGKTGTPIAQTAGSTFKVTVYGVDASLNLVTNVTDTVKITSSDTNAVLPANAALILGTNSFNVTLKTAGSATVTSSDVTDVTKTASTSSSITVAPGALAKMQLLVPGESAAPGTASGK